jgi:hypothetical protein
MLIKYIKKSENIGNNTLPVIGGVLPFLYNQGAGTV